MRAAGSGDPHEPAAVMPAGRYQGRPIDARRRRPVRILPAEEAARFRAQPGELVFANFFAEDRYWIARLPKDAVAEVILQLEKFNPSSPLQFPPHPQFRFKLRPGFELQLFPQKGARLPKSAKISDLTVTAWTASIHGKEFSVPSSVFGDYVRYVRVMGSEDAFLSAVVRGKHEVTQIQLKLSDEKKTELLETGIRLSDEQSFNRMFNVLDSNCRTFAFCDLFQGVMKEELSEPVPNLSYTDRIRRYLGAQGLVDPETGGLLPEWKVEWADRIPRPSKKVLVFSFSGGGGHDTSAKAIRDRILAMDPQVEVVIKDSAELAPLGIGKAYQRAQDYLYQRQPGLYAKLRDGQVEGADRARSAAEQPSLVSQKKLLDYLVATDPDLVVTTYNGIVPALAKLRSEGRIGPENFKMSWLLENFSDEPWYRLKAEAMDMTWTPHPEITRSWLEQGLSAGQVKTTGLPLNPKIFAPFEDKNRRAFLKKALITQDAPGSLGISVNGRLQTPVTPNPTLLDPDVKTIFLSSGRSGAGDFPRIVEDLIRVAVQRKMRLQIIAGCGTNETNYEALRRLSVPEGITLAVSKSIGGDKQISYTRSADLLIGKSGSQGPTEFALSGNPRVLVDVIGGQERANAEFFRKQGLAEVVPGNEQGRVAEVAFALLDNPEKLKAMRDADKAFREKVTYEPIDDWVRTNLADSALAERVPTGGKVSNWEDARSNMSRFLGLFSICFKRKVKEAAELR